MVLNFHEKSSQLLTRIGNSIYERGALDAALFTFNTKEMCIVEEWIKELLVDVEAQKVETNKASGTLYSV